MLHLHTIHFQFEISIWKFMMDISWVNKLLANGLLANGNKGERRLEQTYFSANKQIWENTKMWFNSPNTLKKAENN